jgi:hypothetical protein
MGNPANKQKTAQSGTAVAPATATLERPAPLSNVLPNPPAPGAKTPWGYRVTLQCPTPIANNGIEITAKSETEAWAKFCDRNGITGSEHPKQIEPLY